MPTITPDKFMDNDCQCVWKKVYFDSNGKRELKNLPLFLHKDIDPVNAKLEECYPEI